MVRRSLLVAVALVAASLAGASPAAAGTLRAGVGVTDATWHVGASAGQYAHGRQDSTDFDPSLHSYKNGPSYGIQSRLEARAVVVEEEGGERFAVVKSDLYIPQDLLFRRVAQLAAAQGTGIDRTNLVMAVTHDHSSPFYTSTAWGAWSFQDVFDIRAYEYYARQMAAAIKKASDAMVPVRVGATTTTLDAVHRNALGPAIADDGTPAGFPYDFTDKDLSVVRFDDVSRPGRPKPLAVLLNYSLHPESLDGNNLISADYVGSLERMVDRATGATTVFTQSAVGSAEPEQSLNQPPRRRLEFNHREYGQAEWAARLIAGATIGAWREAGGSGARVPPVTDATVDFEDRWFPGPLTHPYPAVSNCRSNTTVSNPADPQLPVVGLPDCAGPSTAWDMIRDETSDDLPEYPRFPGVTADQLKALGIPVPDNYGAPAFTGLEEDVSVHLQAFRIGDLLFTVCPCEQWADQSMNIKTRTDRTAGNEFLGYDWSARCTPAGEGAWSCPRPGSRDARITVGDAEYQKMRAQVRNDAAGWNSLAFAPWAESEPPRTADIKGNYTQDDNAQSARLGYGMTVAMSMANDYNGYIATYREYQRGDHYRKALTGWGPHSSDYMATRLVKLGRLLRGGPALDRTIRGTDDPAGVPDPDADQPALMAKSVADVAQNDTRAAALGTGGQAAVAAYEKTLPDDDGPPAVVRQPPDVQRFDLASLEWIGGSNYTDSPRVRVERLEDGTWVRGGDMSGEVVATLKYPAPGGRRWLWTAHFEPYVSWFDPIGARQATPPGRYRFVVDGDRRTGGASKGYRVVSRTFDVGVWTGITVEDVRVEPGGAVSFRVGPRRANLPHREARSDSGAVVNVPNELGPIDYPDSYAGRRAAEKAPFIEEERRFVPDPEAPGDPARFELFCLECSFRPWLDTGDADRATVTFASAAGRRRVGARRSGGRWETVTTLRAGEAAYVCPGDVSDPWRDVNGALSAAVGAREVVLDCRPLTVVGDADAGGGAAQAARAGSPSLGLPAKVGRRGRRCISRRRFAIRVKRPRRGVRLRRATVRVNGKKVRVRRGKRLRAVIDLRGMRRRTVRVTIRAKASDGRTYVSTRRYRTCRPKRR